MNGVFAVRQKQLYLRTFLNQYLHSVSLIIFDSNQMILNAIGVMLTFFFQSNCWISKVIYDIEQIIQ